MSLEASTRLVAEVRDLLDASSVGLYEFLWILRGHHPEAANEELRLWAWAALTELLASGTVRLVLLGWPSEDSIGVGPVAPPAPGADAWDEPIEGGSYLAIVRN